MIVYRPRVIREKEPERCLRQHLVVHRTDLVRKRLHVTRGDCEHRIAQAGESDTLRSAAILNCSGSASNRARPLVASLRFDSSLRKTIPCSSPTEP